VRSVRSVGEGRDIIVAIDAGHGGQDPGATGRSGTREKDVVLGIARALARRIDAEPGMRAVLTRGNDTFIPLRERMTLARAGRADLFVSVHADAIANRSVSGSSVYVLSDRGASNESARWLAERENAADLKGGVSLGDKQGQLASVLMDLSQTASIGSSMEAAGRVLGYMDRIGEVRKSQVQQAAFVVLKSPDIPSMLVETAYISNPDEEKRLRTPQHQERIANAIFAGVRDYFRSSPPDGSLFAQAKSRGGAASIMAVNAGP
jgi:N-acetylmuramoyl-L-alanine amidase